MARPIRIEIEGALYHISARGNGGKNIFRSDRDREKWCDFVGMMVEKRGVEVMAYVLMENHYHLVVHTPRANISRSIQWLNMSYTLWFNQQHKQSGRLFQGRFSGKMIDPKRLRSVIDHVHLNPARVIVSGLAKAGSKRDKSGKVTSINVNKAVNALKNHLWSSYSVYTGKEKGPEWLNTKAIVKQGLKPGATYRADIEKKIKSGLTDNPWNELKRGLILGDEAFASNMLKQLKIDKKAQQSRHEIEKSRSWGAVVAAVEKVKKEKWKNFVNQYGDWGRDMAMLIARKRCDMTLRQIGDKVGVNSDSGIFCSMKIMEKKIQENDFLQKAYRKVNQLLNSSLRN